VPLASIVVTTNTRKVFDETALAELAESVKAHGILQPIVLRPHTEAGKYELVAGGRRYRAAQLAGLAEMPATVRNLNDREFMEVQLLENLQRVDVRPADEAEAFARLLANGYSAEEIGLKVGKGGEFVTKRAKLTALTPFWLDLLSQERLPLLAAHELARLPEAGQKLVANSLENSWEFRQGKILAVDSVRSTINSQVLRQLGEVPWSLDDETLYPEAGPCSTCPKRSGACRGLFDDLHQAGKPDTCLDATCFATKRSLLVQRRIIELKGTAAPLLSTENWDRAPSGVLGYKYWDSAKEGEKGAVQGLVTDGSNAGHLKWVKLKNEAKDAAAQAEKKKVERAAEIRTGKINEANRALLARHLYTQALGGRVLEQHLENELYGQLRSQGGPHTPLRLALVTDFGWELPEGGEKALRKLTPASNFSGLQAWVKHNVSRLNYEQKLALHFAILGYNCSTFESSNGRLSAYAKQAGANTAHLLKLATEAVDGPKQGKQKEATA
jgi:ParB/RepB/Spo0J family partition protein